MTGCTESDRRVESLLSLEKLVYLHTSGCFFHTATAVDSRLRHSITSLSYDEFDSSRRQNESM